MISNRQDTIDIKIRCRDCALHLVWCIPRLQKLYPVLQGKQYYLKKNIFLIKSSTWPGLWKHRSGQNTYRCPWTIHKIPKKRIHIDIIGPFTESVRGNRYIVNMIDKITKWLGCYAIPNQGAEQVAMSLVERVIVRMGCPFQIHSDQGRNFMSDLSTNFVKC